MTDPTDIIDRIDEIVDAQLEQEASGYDHNLAQARCWHCGREWHGLAITARLEEMRERHAHHLMLAELCGVLNEDLMHRPAVDPDYRYADDNSEILCPGSAFIGPRAPTSADRAMSLDDWIRQMIGPLLSPIVNPLLLGLDDVRPYSYRLPTIEPGDRIGYDGGDGVVHVHEATADEAAQINYARTVGHVEANEPLREFIGARGGAPYIWGGNGSFVVDEGPAAEPPAESAPARPPVPRPSTQPPMWANTPQRQRRNRRVGR